MQVAVFAFESRRNPNVLNLLIIDEIQRHHDRGSREKIAKEFIPKIAEGQQLIISTSDKDFYQTLKESLPKEDSIFYENLL